MECIWLLSSKLTSVRLIHVVACGNGLGALVRDCRGNFAKESPIVWIYYNLPVFSSVNVCFGCLQFGAIIKLYEYSYGRLSDIDTYFFWLLFFLYIHFVYLCGCATSLIFIAACRIFSYGKQTFSCGMWDLVPWPGIEPRAPTLEALRLSLWTTREVPLLNTLASSYQESLMVYVYLPWRIISFLNVGRNLWLVHWGFPE